MEEKLKISVIVPVYNRFEYVENILRCLKKQSVQPFEVIFADDGSKDDLKTLLKKHKEECAFKIKHVYQKDKGFRKSKSCNNAVLESEGEYLIFLDQDAIFPRDLVEEFIKRAAKGKFSILRVLWSAHEEMENIQKEFSKGADYGELLKFISSDEKRKLKKYLWRDRYCNFRFRLGLRDRGAGLMGIGFALYKDDYIKVNGYDEDYEGWGGEDADLGYRLYNSGLKSVTFTTDLPAIHMCHPLDKTKTGDKNQTLFDKKKSEFKNNRERKALRSLYGIDNRKEKDEYSIDII